MPADFGYPSLTSDLDVRALPEVRDDPLDQLLLLELARELRPHVLEGVGARLADLLDPHDGEARLVRGAVLERPHDLAVGGVPDGGVGRGKLVDLVDGDRERVG